MILSLPLSLPDATPIGDQHAMQTRAGITYYFYNLEPYDCHPAGDRRAMLLRAAKLQVVSRVRQRDLMRAFQVSRPTVARAVRRYREHGEDAFYEPLRRRGRTVVDAELADKATNLLASGMSGNACARQLGIAATTFKANRRAGVIVDPARTHTGSVDVPQPHQAPVADHAPSVDAPQTHQAPPIDRATRDGPRQASVHGPRGARRRGPRARQRRLDDRGHAGVRRASHRGRLRRRPRGTADAAARGLSLRRRVLVSGQRSRPRMTPHSPGAW